MTTEYLAAVHFNGPTCIRGLLRRCSSNLIFLPDHPMKDSWFQFVTQLIYNGGVLFSSHFSSSREDKVF